MDQANSFTIKTNNDENRTIVLTNLIKMLTNRGLLERDNLEKNINKIKNESAEKSILTIKLDNPDIYYPKNDNTKVLYVKMILQKFTNISKNSSIIDFLNTYKSFPKIIIVKEMPLKTIMNINTSSEFPMSEIFNEVELMINLVDHILVPKHILLSNEDSEKVIKEYKIKKKELQKYLNDDLVSRYYNAKVGQIFTIIRSSNTTLESSTHKIVYKSIQIEE